MSESTTATAPEIYVAPLTQRRIDQARHRQRVIEAFELLQPQLGNRKAARKAGASHATIWRWQKMFNAGGRKLEALFDRTHRSGRKARVLALTQAETEAIRANKLLNNRDKNSGGTPDAIRQTIREGGLRPETASILIEREAAGKPMVTPSIANDLHISPMTTKAFRNGRNAWLDYVESPGSLHMTRDAVTGETRMWEPGECCTIDDGTKNLICTVPMQRPGDKCYEKFGVVIGRWQILLLVDHRSYFIMGYCHTARPKGSYRAEDMQAAMHIAFKQHGRPRNMILEKGISKSEILHATLDRAGVSYEHVNSPHQKVVEFVFNTIWSKLSFLPGQVGRIRGEEAEVDAIVESCKRGATDPRGYFLPLSVVLRALEEGIAEWNSHRVNSSQYGSWIPAEWFASAAPTHLRRLEPIEEWIFSPTVSAPLLVRAMNIRTSFLVMPGYSWQFDYSAPFFADFYRARVQLHYNPFEPEAVAKVVLAEDFHGVKAGTVLGDAEQMNWHTRHSRRLLGIMETEDIGLVKTRMNAMTLRRSAVAIRPDGKPGVEKHDVREVRDPQTETFNIQHSTPNAEGNASRQVAGVPSRRSRAAMGVSQEDFERQAARLERDAQRADRLAAKNILITDD